MRSLSAHVVPKEQTAETLPSIFIIIKKTPRTVHSIKLAFFFTLLRFCVCAVGCVSECEQSEKGVRSLIVLK